MLISIVNILIDQEKYSKVSPCDALYFMICNACISKNKKMQTREITSFILNYLVVGRVIQLFINLI